MNIIRVGVVFMLGIAVCSALASVTSMPSGDTTPPVISNVTVLFDSSIIITWDTDEISDSVVLYGIESGHHDFQKSDPAPVLFHSIRLEDIKEAGTYYFVVRSTDPSGNVAQTPEHEFFLATPPYPLNPRLIESFWLLLILAVILATIPAVVISVVLFKNKEQAEELKQKTVELTRRVDEFKKIRAEEFPKPGLDEVKEVREIPEQEVDDRVVKAQVAAPQGQATDELKEIKAEVVPTPEPEFKESQEIKPEVVPTPKPGFEELKEIKAEVAPTPEPEFKESQEIKPEVVPIPKPGFEELKEIKAEVAPTPEPGLEELLEELKEIKAEAIPKPVQPADELKEIKAEGTSEFKADERNGSKTALSLPIDYIRDMIREKSTLLTIKYISTPNLPPEEQRLPSEQLLTTYLSADEHVLNEVERKLVLSLAASTFNVYFMPANESMGKGVEPEKGLLKMTSEALWIIGRASLKRIAGEDIIQVKQVRRSSYQGTDYSAISIEYLDEGSTNAGVLSPILIITKGNTTEVLLKHIQELADAYTLKEKLSETENRILSLMHAGALDLPLSKLTLTAQALKLSVEELMNHLEHLNELGVIDLANQTVRKKGIKYLLSLSKQALGG